MAVVDGRRGLRQAWLPAVVAGVAFGVVQFVASNYVSVTLTDIFASLAVRCSRVVLLLRVWQPVESPDLGRSGRRRCATEIRMAAGCARVHRRRRRTVGDCAGRLAG